MAASITQESIENFRRGIEGDRFFGVCDINTRRIHLTIGGRADHQEIPVERRSIIVGLQRDVLEGRGGHATMARWAGVQARQVRPGVAEGSAYGFMFELGAEDALSLTVRSGFNGRHPGDRPAGTAEKDKARTLPVTLIDELKVALGVLNRRISLNLGGIEG